MNLMKRFYILPVLLLLVFMAVGAVDADKAYADIRIWHEVNMQPGGTYDVGKAEANTTVFIKQPGKYTLKGESRHVRVIVQSGGAEVYLADGLNINCSATSYAGTGTAAIWVDDVDGTIKIISEENADVYLEGYMMPGIRKQGRKSELVFETQDPNNPGTITARGGAEAAGIGSVFDTGLTRDSIGNITFESGNIIASGKDTGAGIGGNQNVDAHDITINGGYIQAYSSGVGAGIGCGQGARAEDITINGGTVYAESEYGAGIGSGGGGVEGPHVVKNIIINGGEVTAVTSGYSACIGAGEGDGATGLQINGGTVIAKNKGKGFGIGGSDSTSPKETSIKITGGNIVARGGDGCAAIGSGGDRERGKDPNTCDIEISGGTIIADGGAKGCDVGCPDDCNIVITGGSITSSSGDTITNGNVMNGDKDEVKQMNVTCTDLRDDGLFYMLRELVFESGYEYGIKDVELLNIDNSNHTGMFYPWLPDSDLGPITAMLLTEWLTESGTPQSKESPYFGSIDPKSQSGDLSPVSGIEPSGTLLMKMTAKGKTSLNLSWLEVTGADGYDIFFSRCSYKGRSIPCKLVKTIDSGDTLSWKKTGLKKGKTYKAYVKAFVMKGGNKEYVKTSPTVHAYARGYSKKYTNAKSVKVKKAAVTLAAGKTFKIKASVKKLKKNRKLISKSHAAKLRYLSSDTDVATVSKSGKIKAKAAGTCQVYVFAANGVYKTVKVTVK